MGEEEQKPNKTPTRYLEFSFTLQKHAIPEKPSVWAFIDIDGNGERSQGETVPLSRPKKEELKWTSRFYFDPKRVPEGLPLVFWFRTSYGAGNYWEMVVKNDAGKDVAKLDGPVKFNETLVRTVL